MTAETRHYRLHLRQLLFVALAALPLADCASMAPKTTALKFLVTADNTVNPDERGNPYPIVVRIYELKQASQFNQLSYFELTNSDVTKLGSDLVAKREIELKPGDTQTFDRDTPIETHNIGVIAGFRNIDNAQWRAVAEIKPERGNQVVIKVTAYSVSVRNTPDKTLGVF